MENKGNKNMIFCTDLVLTKTSFWASFRIRGKTKKMFFSSSCSVLLLNTDSAKPLQTKESRFQNYCKFIETICENQRNQRENICIYSAFIRVFVAKIELNLWVMHLHLFASSCSCCLATRYNRRGSYLERPRSYEFCIYSAFISAFVAKKKLLFAVMN
jgi:hypothetical protein